MVDRNTSIRRSQLKPIQYDDLEATNAAVDNYVPSYDEATGKFTWIAVAGGVTNLSDLDDVVFDSGTPTNNQVLTYDSASGKWKAEDPQAGLSGDNVDDFTIKFVDNKLKVADRIELNQMLNSFRIAVNGSLTQFSMIDGMVDEFEDESGIDTGASTYEDYDSVNDLYKPTTVAGLELDYMEYASDGAAQAAYVTDASGLELDYMEYASNGAAQNAYVSGDKANSAMVSVTTGDSSNAQGDFGGTEFRNAQSFLLAASQTIVTGASFGIDAIENSPTGSITIRIETDDGGLPSGTLANASATVVVVPAVGWNDGTFPAPFTLLAGVKYWMVLDCDDQENNKRWEIVRGGSIYTDGEWAVSEDGGSTWEAQSHDMDFKIFGPALQCYSENSIINQGSYSLKAVAAITDSLNDTLTKSSLSLDLTDKDTVKLWVYASRTGTDIIQARLYDSVGGWITKDISTVVDTWTEITWDISGVSNANKSNITKIEFKILNADSTTTYYIDNFRVVGGLQSYSEDTIINQGTYSLKVIANQTDSLNKTLTKSSLSLDLTDKDELKIDVYVERIGTNIRLKIHDSGGTTSTKDIIIGSGEADTWKTITWDISGISNANKDDIDSIIVEIINADATNTFYVDNFYAPTITNNMILISDSFIAEAIPEVARIVLFEEDVDSITENTDIKAYVSRDGGSTYAQTTLLDEGDYASGKRILTGIVDLTQSGIGSGTNIEYKITTHNAKSFKLHCVGLHWN